MDFTSKEQTPRTFLRWYSFWLTSNQFNWLPLTFFQSKRYPGNFNQWNRFLRKSYTRVFSQNLPVTEVSLIEFHSFKTVLFRYSSLKLNFRQIPVYGVGFYNFSMEDNNFRGFPVHEAHFRGFLLSGNKFLGFSRMKLISIDFQSTSYMLHGVTNADMFFPWVSEYLKLTSLLVSMNLFPRIFFEKKLS